MSIAEGFRRSMQTVSEKPFTITCGHLSDGLRKKHLMGTSWNVGLGSSNKTSAGSVSGSFVQATPISPGRCNGSPKTFYVAEHPISVFTIARIPSSTFGKFSTQWSV